MLIIPIPIPGKLVCKLIETLEKSVAGYLAPWQILRIAGASLESERRDKLLSAQTEKDVELIKQGKAVLDSQFNLIPNPEIDNTANNYIKTARSNQTIKTMIKELNIGKAILHAKETLKDDQSTPSEEAVDQDWLTQWFEYAGLVSEEKLQQLWGKILAGEVKSPGKYSLRTLNLIKQLNKKDAESISKLAPFMLDNFIVSEADSVMNLPAELLLHCQELQLIQGVGGPSLRHAFVSMYADRFAITLTFGDKLFIVTSSDPKKENLILPVYSITSIGKEVVNLINSNIDETYLIEIGKYITRQGFNVQVSTK
ncbi:MAG: hypothetical protein K0R12_1279 [Gammaproteobacteria bacterium]|jgi:hypothetical protein|nr:hypothetical protein [Gammaproteobacteria bacterium]